MKTTDKVENGEKEEQQKFEIGELVSWCQGEYTIIAITQKGVKLKQNFSIGINLSGLVPLSELRKME